MNQIWGRFGPIYYCDDRDDEMEHKEQILVVEDDQVLADLLWRNLRKLQYVVTDVVLSGEEALKKAESKRPDLVLMDIRLGGQMTGIETADLMRTRFNLPVVYVTAYSDKETLDKVKKTEPYGYILKPFDSKDLQIAIEMALYKHKIEKKLREREIWFSTTLKSIGDAVISTDNNGNITFMNPIAQKLTGWSIKEARGVYIDDVFNIISSVGRHQLASPVQAVIARNSIINYSVPKILLSKDGTEISIDDSWAPIHNDDNNQLSGIVLVFRDITERKKLEEDVQKNQKIESIGLLAGGIAHDFNNRLSVILGNAQLAKLNYDKGKDISKYLDNIEKSTDQATTLTQQLLTFSKGGEPVKKVSDIKELIRETANLSLSGSNEKCVFDIVYNLYPVNVDKGQISQVINNIVLNADQAMPNGGIIYINAKNITLSDHKVQTLSPGKYIKIEIIDSGSGMDDEIIHKIFDPYFTTKQKGSGLGLSVAYSIVRKHGGAILVDSVLDSGSTFSVFLPAVEEKIKEEEKEKERAFKGAGKVLVMDDEELVLQMVGDILKGVGYEIELATDGIAAIEHYQGALKSGDPFDVVLLDLTVPGGMGGKETVQKLIEIDPNVKAVVSSGYSNDPIMANFKQYGIAGVIAKPYRIMELCKTLKSVVED